MTNLNLPSHLLLEIPRDFMTQQGRGKRTVSSSGDCVLVVPTQLNKCEV